MRKLAAVALVLLLLVIGCGGDDEGDGKTSPEPQAAPASEKPGGGAAAEKAAPGTEIKVADSEFGEVIWDRSKQAIYLFDIEESSKSECYGECAAAWPPVLTEGKPVAGAGTDGSLLGTTKRDDGSTQITYNGHPLYYYAHEGPGQILCHNVEEFGGLWLVVDPEGNAVQ